MEGAPRGLASWDPQVSPCPAWFLYPQPLSWHTAGVSTPHGVILRPPTTKYLQNWGPAPHFRSSRLCTTLECASVLAPTQNLPCQMSKTLS